MITIQVNDTISEQLKKLVDRLDNLEPVFDLFAPFVQGELDDQFAYERDVYDVNWIPLKPETVKRKRAESKIEKILQRTGTLRDSAVTQSFQRSFVAGFDLQYGEFHHSKTNRAKGVPRRRLLPDPDQGLPESWSQELEAILGEFLENAWR